MYCWVTSANTARPKKQHAFPPLPHAPQKQEDHGTTMDLDPPIVSPSPPLDSNPPESEVDDPFASIADSYFMGLDLGQDQHESAGGGGAFTSGTSSVLSSSLQSTAPPPLAMASAMTPGGGTQSQVKQKGGSQFDMVTRPSLNYILLISLHLFFILLNLILFRSFPYRLSPCFHHSSPAIAIGES